MKRENNKNKVILIACNIILIVMMVVAAVLYSRHIYRTQEETKKTDFIRTIESMKQVSQNYFDSEKGYVKDWSAYISEHDMTMEEALDFLRSINKTENRFVHIVDMDSYEAYSTYYPKGKEKIDTYIKYKEKNIETEVPFDEIMQSMFDGTAGKFDLLGKYRLQETQSMAVGVGTKVTLRVNHHKKDYLILRIIPLDVLKKTWVFPTEYSSAEIGIITRGGDYVVQSESMKSLNFIEYIRGYNFQDDYNEKKKLSQLLKNTERGTMEYKNFRGTDCVWYYSSFGDNSAMDILGVINKEDLNASLDVWYIVLLVCGILFVLVMIDGAYLLRINRKLRETARLAKEASEAKTQFLSAMSHDIRTPLNAVLGMMTLAQKKADNPEEVTEYMKKGMRSGKQLLTLINDVLDISKIESGKVILNPDGLSLDEITDGLTEMVEQSIRDKGIEFESHFDNLPYKWIYADKMRLNQIYMNLLTNAVKYTEFGGKILLQLYEEESKHTACTKLVFYVEDTGIGMTEEFQKNMYNSFSRETKTQVNSIQGTGLGLSIVKQMVDLMNGIITCKSFPGKGTSFTVKIDFPIIQEELMKSKTGSAASENIENMHLLVAEDNELNWAIFHEFILEQNITCERARNGKECVKILTEMPAGTYHAVLMDIQMPIMNGYEATKAIRALPDERLRGIPIIAMTADAFAEDVQKCINCGMNGHIAKPVDMKKLISCLVKIKNKQL